MKPVERWLVDLKHTTGKFGADFVSEVSLYWGWEAVLISQQIVTKGSQQKCELLLSKNTVPKLRKPNPRGKHLAKWTGSWRFHGRERSACCGCAAWWWDGADRERGRQELNFQKKNTFVGPRNWDCYKSILAWKIQISRIIMSFTIPRLIQGILYWIVNKNPGISTTVTINNINILNSQFQAIRSFL